MWTVNPNTTNTRNDLTGSDPGLPNWPNGTMSFIIAGQKPGSKAE
jgi:hypothetical protein